MQESYVLILKVDVVLDWISRSTVSKKQLVTLFSLCWLDLLWSTMLALWMPHAKREIGQCMVRSNWGIVRKAEILVTILSFRGKPPGGRFTIACQVRILKLHLLTYLCLHPQDWEILEMLMGAPEPFPQKNHSNEVT